MFIRPDRWLFGLPLLLVLAALSIWHVEPRLDAALRHEAIERVGPELASRGLRFELDGRDLRVVADAPVPPDVAGAVRRTLEGWPATRRVVFAVEVPRAASPYRLAVVRHGSAVRLMGHVPPGAARSDLLSRLAETAPGLRVEDELRTATGEPAGFEAVAQLAVAFAARLTDGRATMEDGRLDLSGSAPDAASYDAALAISRAGAATGIVAAFDLRPPAVDRFTWTARKAGGRIELSGFVPSERDREAILASAGPPGTVRDETRTARGPDPDLPVQAAAQAALAWLGRLQAGEVTVNGRSVDARGATPARDLVSDLESRLRTSLPSGLTVTGLSIGTVPASPFRFEALRAEGRLALAGYVPNAEVRATLADLARQRFPFEAVVNDLHVADGAPPGLLDAATLAVTRLSAFADGEAVLTDKTLALTGRILYPEMAERARRGFGTGLPQGWTGTVSIRDGGESGLDDVQCADLLGDAAQRDPVPFEAGSGELGPAGRKAVANWASVAKRCRRAAATLVGLVASEAEPGRAQDLGERRARAVAAGLGPALDGSPFRVAGRPARGVPDRIAVEAAAP